jgi:UDP-N-acetylmuramoyl-tripeptide--D-alanyl-D-alanine ligase
VIDLTADRIKEVCGAALVAGGPGRIHPEDVPRRAVVDSRAVERGDLFVGLRGERVDGGQFAEDAVAAGAWGVLVSMEHALRVVAAGPRRARVLAVDDPLEALGRLARVWVDRLWAEGCKVVGITGSTGKTSTKDILLSLLKPPLGEAVHASPRNYNTEVGLPLAVLEAEPDTRVLILEMAMRGPGQIRDLCKIAPPEVGLITNVGPVHLELMGTVEAVAEAKAELIAALPVEGICVVPAAAEALRPHLRREVRTLTFAEWPNPDGGGFAEVERVAGAAADIRVLGADPVRVGDRDGLRAEIAAGADRRVIDFNFRQAHNVTNALGAIGAAHALGFSLEELAEGAARVTFSDLRGEEIESRGALLINDCYNANPISMRAALDHLATLAAERGAPRSIAVLGEMAELGPEADLFHRRVGEHVADRRIGALIAVGAEARGYVDGYGNAGEVLAAGDAEEAALLLERLIVPGDVVLIKGSRSVGLERVAELLKERDAEGVR